MRLWRIIHPLPKKINMFGLGIDTTFDDTSVAVLKGHSEILSSLTLSQYKDHEEFGGVVPERASRKHLEVIHSLIEKTLQEASIHFTDLDYIAVSNRPGLLGAILVGLTVAKTLAYSLKIPLIGVNHVESHPYGNFLVHPKLKFPLIHLVVAGGHTLLFHATNHFHYTVLGRTIDDAAGECLDKAAKMWGYPMPGGAVIDRLALQGNSTKYPFPRPLLHKKNYDFSFSGLKTAMLYFKKDHPEASEDLPSVFASFFQSVIDVLIERTFRAAQSLEIESITLSGGVAASQKLRNSFQEEAIRQHRNLWMPPPALCTDNAAMVACLGSYKYQARHFDDMELDAIPNF